MDWLKLFTLLVAVASVQIKADGPKKKIRIHLPQKVKHIHHHKKIYITNHPASSQYAPAYMPSAEGAVAVPTNVGLPAVANLLPYNSVEIIDENQHRLPGVSPAASKLIPLYHARGYYGPSPSEVDEEYDLAPPPESVDGYLPSGYSPSPPPSHPVKKVKIVKISEQPRKKVLRKGKPKRVVIRNRPQPPLPADEELPVTTFHEQFYSDIDNSGTIRKIKKPPRVEKIVDGDTEHIHTYSEEHIHKLVFDDSPKYTGIVGVGPMTSMSAINPTRPIVPFKNTHGHSQTLIAIPSASFSNLAAVGPIAATGQFEYTAYNPRDVTHDHIFHDHGEIPADVDITKDGLGLPPKVSYNSQGLRIGTQKRHKSKYGQRTKKITGKPQPTDFSYYESIYAANNRPKKTQRPANPFLDEAVEANLNDYRPNNIRYKEVKPRNLVPTYYGKPGHEYKTQQTSASAPFSVSSTVVHDYKPKNYGSGSSPVQRFNDPFVSIKDNNYASNYEYDTYASSSNMYTSEDKNDNTIFTTPSKKGKTKSFSTQNISFGGRDHLTYVDHLEESSLTDDDTPTALDNIDQFDQPQSDNTQTPYTIKEASPVHPYYSAMAVKTLLSEQPSMPAASNDNYQYVEAPTLSTTPATSAAPTTSAASPTPSIYNSMQSTGAPAAEPAEYMTETGQPKRYKQTNKKFNVINNEVASIEKYAQKDLQTSGEFRVSSLHSPDHEQRQDNHSPMTGRAKLKYGDKI